MWLNVSLVKFMVFYCKNVTTSVKVSRAHRPASLSDLMQSEVTDLVWLITALCFPQRCACESKPASSRLQTGLVTSAPDTGFPPAHISRSITRHTAPCTCATITASWSTHAMCSVLRKKNKFHHTSHCTMHLCNNHCILIYACNVFSTA